MRLKSFTNPNGNILNIPDGHSAFVPNMLPPKINYDDELIKLLSDADRKIGELEGIGGLLKNPHLYIRPHLIQEAVHSSKIEGTLATTKDILQYEAFKNHSKHELEYLRMGEVRNYLYSLHNNLKIIQTTNKKITLSMIKRIHRQLLLDVRGSDQQPEKFRTVQNYIVKHGQSVNNSIYVPPPPTHLCKLLKNFEYFLTSPPKNMPVLIQCAIMHYQFEAIHPFQDGNGRVGRVLILLLLSEKNILTQPLLYISTYFQKYQESYYRGLLETSQQSNWNKWIKFFLQAIIKQADITIQHIRELMKLYNEYRDKLKNMRASANAFSLLDILMENPYITISRAQKLLPCTYPTAKHAIQVLVNAGILETMNMDYKSKVYRAHQIGQILN